MSEENIGKNRWKVVIGALLVQLAAGTIYSWSALTTFVSPYIGEPEVISVYIFGAGLLSFAITMIFAGKLQQKYGPRKIATLGGILIGAGVMLSALMTNFIGLFITYGVVFGAGIGFAYVCPIAAASKWFPDKKGLINGLAVAAFGAGAFVFNEVIKLIAPIGIPILFISLGLIYLALVIGGAFLLNNPPEGWKPTGWVPPPASDQTGISGLDFERRESIKRKQFWMLWLAFFLSAISGLMVIGSYKTFASSFPTTPPSIGSYDIALIILIGSIAALFNAAGRVFWGKISDIISYKRTMMLMFTIQGILMIIYFFTNMNIIFYAIITCSIFFCFGGNFSLFPTATADLFGIKYLGENYGIVFTAYGIAGFIGATMVNTFVTLLGGFLMLYIIMGIMSFGSAIIIFFTKPPKNL